MTLTQVFEAMKNVDPDRRRFKRLAWTVDGRNRRVKAVTGREWDPEACELVELTGHDVPLDAEDYYDTWSPSPADILADDWVLEGVLVER